MPPKRKAKEPQREDSEDGVISQAETSNEGKGPPGFEPYPASNVYRLIEPGPVLLVATGSLDRATHNLMTIGFHMMLQHDPPLIAITLGPWDASFERLKKHRQCVLAIPSVEMAASVVDIGNCSADDDEDDATSKWERFGLEPLRTGERSVVPIVGGPDIMANIECVVEDSSKVARYSMWILRARRAWINPDKKPGEGGKMFHHRGDGTFVVDGEILDLKERMVKWQEFQD